MFIVGLTGGIASGKSLVAGVFKRLGAKVIDADRLVHELLAPGEDAWKEVMARFGAAILNPDQTIDRRRLGDIVFSDPEERRWLNACLHPRVFEAYKARVRHIAEREPDAIVVFDAALLIETGYHQKMDRTVLVYAELEQQIGRLMQRDGFTRGQAMARINAQMPLADKRRFADYVIMNTGTFEEAEMSARDVYKKIEGEAAAGQ